MTGSRGRRQSLAATLKHYSQPCIRHSPCGNSDLWSSIGRHCCFTFADCRRYFRRRIRQLLLGCIALN